MNTQPTYRLLFLLIALIGLAADQASKYGIFAWLREEPHHEQPIISGVFHLVAQHEFDEDGQLVPYVNRGALFGWLGSLGVKANTGFAVISLAAALAILIWVGQRSTAADRWLCVALGLIFAGTLGNLYDRMLFGGVRDFLHWKAFLPEPGFPVFNIADCCLVIGAGLLLIQAFRSQPQVEDATGKASLHVVPAEAKTAAAKVE
jgi:lipoprotein signal peptidase